MSCHLMKTLVVCDFQSLFGEPGNNRQQLIQLRQSTQEKKLLSPIKIKIKSTEVDRLKRKATASPRASLDSFGSISLRTDNESIPDDIIYERAMTRKAHMLKLDEKQLKAQKEGGEEQQIANRRGSRLLERAQKQLEAQSDVAKLIKSQCDRALAFTIRDQQIQNKKEVLQREELYDHRMDLAMELDRLQDLEERDRIEQQKMEQRIADRKIIEDQILDRQRQRMLEEEAKEQEYLMMKQVAQDQKERELARIKERQEQALRTKLEVMKANEQAILKEKEQRRLEKEQDEQILAYQAHRDSILRKREDDEMEAQRQKQELQMKMLEQQTKVLDKRAEMDEIRARRAREANERKYRTTELQEARKRKNELDAILRARKEQAEHRQKKLDQEKEEQHEMSLAAAKLASEMAQRDQLEAEERVRKNAQLRADLRDQIMQGEMIHRQQRSDNFDAGAKAKADAKAEKANLEAFREKKIAELKAKAVPDEYLYEIRAINIENKLMR